MSAYRPLEDRFWEKVQVGEPDECWLWKATRTGKGYGQIRGPHRDGNRRYMAHQVAVLLRDGELPEDEEVHHNCGNKLCVNPSHLVLVSSEEHHLLDGSTKWTEQEIISAIHDFASEYGVAPAATDWNVAKARDLGHHERVRRWEENPERWPSVTVVQRRFGSWGAALRAAGFSGKIGRRMVADALPRSLSAGL